MNPLFSTTEWMLAVSGALFVVNLIVFYIAASNINNSGWLVWLSFAGVWLAGINGVGWWMS